MSLSSKAILGVSVLATMTLGGCAWMPNTGPTASQITGVHRNIQVKPVSLPIASSLWHTEKIAEQEKLQQSFDILRKNSSAAMVSPVLLPGDKVRVKLWSLRMFSSSSTGGNGGSSLRETKFGTYSVTNKGEISLPFLGAIRVEGDSLTLCAKKIAHAYAQRGIFASPQVHLQWIKNVRQEILVTGFARKPIAIPWRNGGITLAQALTDAQGALSGVSGATGGITEGRSVIVREQNLPQVRLSLMTAQLSNVHLIPGTRIFLAQHAPVKIYVLGGGWKSARQESFGTVPTLTRVLAQAPLNSYRANAREIFILSPNHQTIYTIPYGTLDGLEIAGRMPVINNSVVYVSTSESFRLQQIVSLLFTPFYPAAVAKGGF
jgi:protein involved in polysaccharide export with SLBB domain